MIVRLYLLIWFVIALAASSALAQDLPEPIKKNLKWFSDKFSEFLSSHPSIAWTIAVLTMIAMAVAAIAKFTGDLDKIIDFIRKCFFPTKPTASAADIQTIRPKLLRRLKNDVNTRLDTTLHHLVKLDLQMEDQRYRVGQPQINLVPEDTQPVNLLNRVFQLFQAPKSTATQLKPTQRIIEVFDRPDVQGKLLILGEPGSGKTTELLTLAQDWLKRAENDATLPLPIIFELSAWDGQPMEQWLVAQIQDKYKPNPKTIAKALLDEEQVLPLLDGLDELGLVQQRKCIEAINQFMQEIPQMNLVVCCRREEYEQGEVELNELKGAVYLKPLTAAEIEASLRRWNRYSLWDSIKQQAELLDLAQTPLFLTMLVVAYQGQPIRTTHDLLNAYIRKKLHDPESQGTYPPRKEPSPEKTLRYLNWLAIKLEGVSQTEFLIERLQPTWLDSKRQIWSFWLVNGLILSLLYGLLILPSALKILPSRQSLSGQIESKLVLELINGLLMGMAVGSGIGFLGGIFAAASALIEETPITRFTERLKRFTERLKRPSWSWIKDLLFGTEEVPAVPTIKFPEKLSWSWIKGLKYGLRDGLRIWLLFTISYIVMFQVVFPLLYPNEQTLSVTTILLVTLGLALFLGAVRALGKGLTISENSVNEKEEPNQAVRYSIKNSLVLGLILGLVLGPIFGMLVGLYAWLKHMPIDTMTVLVFAMSSGLGFSLWFSLWFSLGFGLFTVFPHFSLRFVIYRSGSGPWNYARFLDHAAKHRFIQRVGGRYRFMHDLLRKYFAGMTSEDIKHLAGG